MYEDGADVHQLWSLFHSELSKEINRFIPQKLCRRTAALPSLNKHRGQLLRRKANLYKMAKSNGNWDAYRQIQRHCKKMMRHVEWDHINNIILEGLQSNNTKPFWRYVKSKRHDNIGVAPLKENGVLHSVSEEKAHILLNQFNSTFTAHSQSTDPIPEMKTSC